MTGRLYLVTAPAERVVTLADLKAHLRVEHSEEDSLISALNLAAEQHLDGRDGILGRAILQQTWDLKLSNFCGDCIPLPLPPLLSVDSVTYYDDANALQTLATSVYEVAGVRSAQPGAVVLKNDQTWPTVYNRAEAVTVRFTAGYVEDNSPPDGDVPVPITQALKMLVAHWYVNREPVGMGSKSAPIPLTVDALLAPYRIGVLG